MVDISPLVLSVEIVRAEYVPPDRKTEQALSRGGILTPPMSPRLSPCLEPPSLSRSISPIPFCALPPPKIPITPNNSVSRPTKCPHKMKSRRVSQAMLSPGSGFDSPEDHEDRSQAIGLISPHECTVQSSSDRILAQNDASPPSLLLGTRHVCPLRLRDIDGNLGIWFILSDLKVRMEGTFQYSPPSPSFLFS